ncbi:MAG: hypothetical protein IKY52_02570, partial [Clostridia bacterium]|nr:hypothetical protein [Clostridia bacterium]
MDETPYIVEAVNFNPDYYRFMASDDEESEEENENVEFMWCANIVDIMPVANMLNDMNKTYVTVHEDAVCGYNGFDEPRSPTFGLSDGTEKVEIEASAIDHHFIWNDTEEMFICFRCLDCIDQTYVDENGVITGHIVTGDPVFVWADDFSSCEIHRDCDVSDCDSEEVHECTVTSEEFDDGLTTVYTATYEEDGVVYTDTKTVVVHVHQLTEEPEFVWGEDEEGNVTATIIFVCISEECDDPDYKATYTCDVEAEADPENEVIVYTATYDVYSDIKRVSTHE